jgi:hypothetical protein
MGVKPQIVLCAIGGARLGQAVDAWIIQMIRRGIDAVRLGENLMITTRGIYHIGIPVNDVERAVKFYTEVLGMKIAKL